jgi:hypothetical protein
MLTGRTSMSIVIGLPDMVQSSVRLLWIPRAELIEEGVEDCKRG